MATTCRAMRHLRSAGLAAWQAGELPGTVGAAFSWSVAQSVLILRQEEVVGHEAWSRMVCKSTSC